MKYSMYTALSRIKFRCVRMKDFMRYLLERYEEAINRFISIVKEEQFLSEKLDWGKLNLLRLVNLKSKRRVRI